MARRYWYAYSGAPGGENVLGNYSFIPSIPNSCSGGSSLCAIYTPGVGTIPSSISSNIKSYIALAKAAHSAYPATGQPYVYTLAV